MNRRIFNRAMGFALAALPLFSGAQVESLHNVNPAVVPVVHDPAGKEWLEKRHADLLQDLTTKDLSKVRVLFVGDSITQGWLWEGRALWTRNFADELNIGVAGDRTEHVLFRLKSKGDGGMGNLDAPDIRPRFVVLMIGTNNLYTDQTPKQIAAGIAAVKDRLVQLEPQAELILCSVLPTNDAKLNRDKVLAVNARIKQLENVHWMDLYSSFVDAEGRQISSLFKDGVHPNIDGYQIWVDKLSQTMTRSEDSK